MKETREIKKIQTQIRLLGDEISEAHRIMAEYQRIYNNKRKEKEKLEKELKEMEKTKLKVTEHAMLRYFERVLGYDLEKISSDIVSQVSSVQSTLGDGKYPCEIDGFKFQTVVKVDNIVTITI